MATSEELFLKYAIPCGQIAVDVLKNLQESELEEFKESIKTGNYPKRERIEVVFPAAFRRLKILAGKMEMEDYWDIEVMKRYWHEDHNKLIDAGDGNYSWFPEFLKEYCKVRVATVLGFKEDGFLKVNELDGGKEIFVSGEYVEGVEVGDRVYIHHAYAVEKFED